MGGHRSGVNVSSNEMYADPDEADSLLLAGSSSSVLEPTEPKTASVLAVSDESEGSTTSGSSITDEDEFSHEFENTFEIGARPAESKPKKRSPQGIFWLCTLPSQDAPKKFPYLPDNVAWIKGQEEIGEGTGFRHWQFVLGFKKKECLKAVTDLFGKTCHGELTYSKGANEYVWKEATYIEGSPV